jgi:hypothetical protein
MWRVGENVERRDFNHENRRISSAGKTVGGFLSLFKMKRRGKHTGMVAVVPSVLQVASFV